VSVNILLYEAKKKKKCVAKMDARWKVVPHIVSAEASCPRIKERSFRQIIIIGTEEVLQ